MSGMSSDEPDILTLPQAARRFGLPIGWLKNQVALGHLPCLRAGRTYIFNSRELERLLVERSSSEATSLEHNASRSSRS